MTDPSARIERQTYCRSLEQRPHSPSWHALLETWRLMLLVTHHAGNEFPSPGPRFPDTSMRVQIPEKFSVTQPQK